MTDVHNLRNIWRETRQFRWTLCKSNPPPPHQLSIYAAWDMYTRGRHADCPAFSSRIAPPPKKCWLVESPCQITCKFLGEIQYPDCLYVSFIFSELSCFSSYLSEWRDRNTGLEHWNFLWSTKGTPLLKNLSKNCKEIYCKRNPWEELQKNQYQKRIDNQQIKGCPEPL